MRPVRGKNWRELIYTWVMTLQGGVKYTQEMNEKESSRTDPNLIPNVMRIDLIPTERGIQRGYKIVTADVPIGCWPVLVQQCSAPAFDCGNLHSLIYKIGYNYRGKRVMKAVDIDTMREFELEDRKGLKLQDPVLLGRRA